MAFNGWRDALADNPTTVLKWQDPNIISDAPALAVLPSGRLLCSVNLWSRDDTAQRIYGTQRCFVFASDNDGATWQEVSRNSFATGKFLVRGDKVYYIGAGMDWEGLWVTSSSDRGQTWNSPTQIHEDKVYACSTGWTIHGQFLYWAADNMQPNNRRVFAIAADLEADLETPGAWRMSPPIVHPGVPQVLGAEQHNGGVWLEPNVIYHEKNLLLVVRVRITRNNCSQIQVLPNVAAVCNLDDDGAQMNLAFSHFHPMPGAQNHFHILFDDITNLHWMTCNHVTGAATDCWHGWANERRALMLQYSIDGLNWFPAGCVAMGSRDTKAFNYCTPVIDMSDLLIAARTARHAPNQHDNDCVTFHRIPHFRSNAMNLAQSKDANV